MCTLFIISQNTNIFFIIIIPIGPIQAEASNTNTPHNQQTFTASARAGCWRAEKKAPKKKHTDSKLEWGSSVVSSKLNEALIMHSNEIQFEYSAFVRHTLGRLNFTAEASDFLSVGSDNNKSSDYCLRLNVSTHEDDSDSPKKVKKKSELSSINARSIKLSLLFFIVTSA